jgi:hypothetical protein
MEGFNMINAYLYSVKQEDCAADKWDYGLLKQFFNKNNIKPDKVTTLPNTDRAFVVIPGPQNVDHEDQISEELNKINRVVLFITGDESAQFNVDKISHSNISIWVQYPHQKHEQYNRFFIGPPQHLKSNLPDYPVKEYDIYFGGQITHQRRQQLAEVMPSLPNALYRPTEGFAQGEQPKDYYRTLSKARVVPAPAGAQVIDTFRFFEAIEMLALPVGDLVDSKGEMIDYFNYVYPAGIPIEKVKNWNQLQEMLPNLINNYPNNMHQVVCWWIKYKRDFFIKIMKDLYE